VGSRVADRPDRAGPVRGRAVGLGR